MFSKTTVAAVAALVAEIASAASLATVKNQCSQNVYLWTVSNFAGEMQTIAPGDSFSENYLTNPNGGGVSLKLSFEPHLSGPITQYEYTLTESTLWYDVSNVDGSPFTAGGLTLIPSDTACRSVVCAAGVALCSAVYNQPKDDWATAACGPTTDTTLILCSGQQDTAKPVESAIAIASSIEAVITGGVQKAAVDVAQATTTPAAAAPPPPPATQVAPPPPPTTPAPAYVAPVVDVIFTTFVTEYFTVYADAKKAKRDSLHKGGIQHRHHFHHDSA